MRRTARRPGAEGWLIGRRLRAESGWEYEARPSDSQRLVPQVTRTMSVAASRLALFSHSDMRLRAFALGRTSRLTHQNNSTHQD